MVLKLGTVLGVETGTFQSADRVPIFLSPGNLQFKVDFLNPRCEGYRVKVWIPIFHTTNGQCVVFNSTMERLRIITSVG